MQISFTTKEESKAAQREAFLKLKPAERFVQFVILSKKMMALPTSAPPRGKDNFIINFEKQKKK